MLKDEFVPMPYAGSFRVELTEKALMRKVTPRGTRIEGQVVHVLSGRVIQLMGGIQLYSCGYPFSWDYIFIKAILTPENKYIWKNRNY